MSEQGQDVLVELNAVIVAVDQDTPKILTVDFSGTAANDGVRLPSGSLDPSRDRTLDLSLRRWVQEQTALELGYIEQLYTFGDRDRIVDVKERVLSIAYLALTRQEQGSIANSARWTPWYDFLPWEDWRNGAPEVIGLAIVPALLQWADAAPAPLICEQRRERIAISFGVEDAPWDPVRVLERYELLYEAHLIRESNEIIGAVVGEHLLFGAAMDLDHRRIVATAMSRLRGKLTYRPVVFELLSSTFTLSSLQRVVEALAGVRLHKPNFRRLVEQAQLVEGTGRVDPLTGGRPAELFQFRREVLRERPAPGVVLPRRSHVRLG